MALTEEEKKERSQFLQRLEVTDRTKKTDYAFISYSSSDWRTVFQSIILPMQEKSGLKVYADKAFEEDNEDWVIQMQNNLRNDHCKAVIIFVSETYIRSHACLMEVLNAINHKKEIIPVFINGSDVKRMEDGAYKIITLKPKIKDAIINLIERISNKDKKVDLIRGTMEAFESFQDSLRQDKMEQYDLTVGFKAILESIPNHMTFSASVEENDRDKIIARLLKISPTICDISTSLTNTAEVGLRKMETVQKESAEEKHTETESFGEKPVPGESAEEKHLVEESTEEIVFEASEDSCFSRKTRAASSTGDIVYRLYGKEYTDNQANMQLRVFAQVLKRHPEAFDKIFEEENNPAIRCVSRTNYELPENRTADMPSRYNAGAFFDIYGGIYVGTSLNYPEKLRNIAKLLTICGEDNSILESDVITLPTQVRSRDSGQGKEIYSIYGREYFGDQTDMMTDTMKFIIEKHFDRKVELESLLSVKFSPLSELKNLTYFRAGREYTFQGVTYSVGTSFGRDAKLTQIRKAIQITGEDPNQFVIRGLYEEKVRVPRARKNNFLDEE